MNTLHDKLNSVIEENERLKTEIETLKEASQENKQLQLDAMQGIADLYAMQMGGGQ